MRLETAMGLLGKNGHPELLQIDYTGLVLSISSGIATPTNGKETWNKTQRS